MVGFSPRASTADRWHREGYAPAVEQTVQHRRFAANPVGRALLADRWMVWCELPGLSGTALWGDLQPNDVRRLVAILEGLARGRFLTRFLFDASALTSMDPAGFDALRELVRDRIALLDQRGGRWAILDGPGVRGAVAAAIRPLDPQHLTVRMFEKEADALGFVVGEPSMTLLDSLRRIRASASQVDPVISRVRSALAEHLAEGATLEELGRALGMSARTIQRRLGEAGTSLREEWSHVRLEAAKRRLAEPAPSMAEIASELGFSAPQNFSAWFRKKVGTAPSDWRDGMILPVAHGGEPPPRETLARRPAESGPTAERDTFHGRHRELKALRELLIANRLVTVTGIGGLGKTRLAKRFANVAWSGTLWFCDIADAKRVDDLYAMVARVLDAPLDADPRAQLGRALHARGAGLFILDGLEHLLARARDAVEAWLEAAPRMRFLVTSRSPLGLGSETLLELGPLQDDDDARLFVARGAEADPAFRADSDVVRHIADLLEGHPLSIELAAARVRILSLDQILHRMSDRLVLLAARDVGPERHRSLRAALDWSWDLLSPFERAALAELTVFEGGFSIEAAEAVVCHRSGAPPVLDLLQALASASLIRKEGSLRLTMLSGVQAFAAERLEDRPATESRHARWFAQATDLGFDDFSNLVAATRRILACRDGSIATPLFERLWDLAWMRGPRHLVESIATELVALPELGDSRPQALLMASEAAHWIGRPELALELAEQALAASTTLGDRAAVCRATLGLGADRYLAGDMGVARTHLERALEIAQELGDPRLLGSVHAKLGVYFGILEDAPRSRKHFEAALRDPVDANKLPFVHNGLGALCMRIGELDEARHHLEAALAAARRVGNRRYQIACHTNLGVLAAMSSDVDTAQTQFTAALLVSREIGSRREEGMSLANLAESDWQLGEHARSLERLGQAIGIALEVSSLVGACYAMATRGDVLLDLDRIDEAQETFQGALDRAQHRVPAVHVRALLGLAEVDGCRGDVPAGLARIRLAEEMIPERDTSPHGHARVAVCQAWLAFVGRDPDASAALERAAAVVEAGGRDPRSEAAIAYRRLKRRLASLDVDPLPA